MAFSRFRTSVVVRIALILAFGYATIYIAFNTHFWLVSLWTGLATVIGIISLVRYVERSNREMASFLMSIKQGDFTNTFGRTVSQKNADLSRAYSDILDVFQRLSTERETNHLFLQTVVEHISTALITFDEEGEIISYNKAARTLLNRPYLKNLAALNTHDPELYNKLSAISPDQGELIKVVNNGELLSLSLRSTNFMLKDHQYKIVSLQDIKNELEEKEVESWQKLIRVLTHEIMNSAIPISTLSAVISEMLEDKDGQPKELSQLDNDVAEDVLGGLKTIETRSKGLVKFVDSYKSLTKIDPPSFEEINLGELTGVVETLLMADLKKNQIVWENKVDAGLVIKGDMELLQQVLINLVKNAIEALRDVEKGEITLASTGDPGGVTLTVSDNGPGITQENLDNIFVPFFSTKKKGSGIGLSLSRQIMRLHKGSISVVSRPGEGTKFTLRF